MMPVILVGGTWSNKQKDILAEEWWKPGSKFYYQTVKHGYKVYSFAWTTNLEGVLGKNEEWDSASERFSRIVPENAIIVAHSHGGQIPILAAAKGFKVKSLVTVATPVRGDMPYKEASKNIAFWSHIYGNYKDYMQILGSLMVGKLWALKRQMPEAGINIYHPAAHSELINVELWNERNWWRLLRLGTVIDI